MKAIILAGIISLLTGFLGLIHYPYILYGIGVMGGMLEIIGLKEIFDS